jgi:hypothetical protein
VQSPLRAEPPTPPARCGRRRRAGRRRPAPAGRTGCPGGRRYAGDRDEVHERVLRQREGPLGHQEPARGRLVGARADPAGEDRGQRDRVHDPVAAPGGVDEFAALRLVADLRDARVRRQAVDPSPDVNGSNDAPQMMTPDRRHSTRVCPSNGRWKGRNRPTEPSWPVTCSTARLVRSAGLQAFRGWRDPDSNRSGRCPRSWWLAACYQAPQRAWNSALAPGAA